VADDELAEARARFVATATGYWTAIREKDAQRGTAQTEEGERIVEEWTARGLDVELLRPLLSDPSAEVRYAAAAHLLHGVEAQAAASVLEELGRAPMGLVAPTAKMLLIHWRQSSH
jgi:hypothetical protein